MDQSIKVSQKHLRTNDEEIRMPWLRNFNNGYVFRKPTTKLPKVARNSAKAAITALNLDFGAVDLIVSDEGRPIILEVNTGPGLIAVGIEKYATKLAELCDLRLNTRYIDQLKAEETNGDLDAQEEA
jgi:hypothetical protein